jgi:hypothetical protein
MDGFSFVNFSYRRGKSTRRELTVLQLAEQLNKVFRRCGIMRLPKDGRNVLRAR